MSELFALLLVLSPVAALFTVLIAAAGAAAVREEDDAPRWRPEIMALRASSIDDGPDGQPSASLPSGTSAAPLARRRRSRAATR
jgi:hypothetical protein